MKVGDFFAKYDGEVVGYMHDRAPCNGANTTVKVYLDKDGDYWVESPDGVSYVGAKPDGRIYKDRLDAMAGPLVASFLREDFGDDDTITSNEEG